MEKGKSKQVSLFPTPTMQHHYNKALKKHTTHAAMGKQLRAKTPERVNNGDEKKHVASGTLQGVSFSLFFYEASRGTQLQTVLQERKLLG